MELPEGFCETDAGLGEVLMGEDKEADEAGVVGVVVGVVVVVVVGVVVVVVMGETATVAVAEGLVFVLVTAAMPMGAEAARVAGVRTRGVGCGLGGFARAGTATEEVVSGSAFGLIASAVR